MIIMVFVLRKLVEDCFNVHYKVEVKQKSQCNEFHATWWLFHLVNRFQGLIKPDGL